MKHRIFNKELWYSFIAIAKHIPNELTTPRINGSDFYIPEVTASFVKRIQGLSSDASPVWGTMSVAQMLHHLSLSLGGALGFYAQSDESYWLSRTLFKWILIDLSSAQPKGLRLPLNFVILSEQNFDFEEEKKILLAIINRASTTKSSEDWSKHPLFGKMTSEQWGKLAQMHIDYHLRQFNV
ncbi:DUF1569 domain-containing protein [Chitinophaga sp. CF418]|uniref:DUF1569 domain-containing protein n=1 Tax=Chitinophaga sp. CF418 TaxID=1855287 RepID=UPI00091933B0|nr:DUF1569 domain-containing protein [Chitinophaga sp. CF418]SHN45169.1 Protein of unknown function [Chitinophaga sp. CF418]